MFISINRLLPPSFSRCLDLQLQYQKNQSVLKHNQELKNKYSNQTCYIIGNGPSLGAQNLLKLKDKQTFVVNHFSLHPQYKAINPKYYVVLDPVVFTRPLLFDHFYPPIKKANLTSTSFFFPLSTRPYINKHNLFPDNPLYFLIGKYSDYSSPSNFDLSHFSQFIDSSPIFVLLLAVYMGFRLIYLLGNDLTFLDGETHFYPNFRKNESDPYLLNKRSNADRALILHQLLAAYQSLLPYLKKHHVKVYNATPGGYLDVFPRVKYSQII